MPKGVYIRKPFTEEHKKNIAKRKFYWGKKISRSMKGRILDISHCKAISEARKGMKFTQQHKENIAKAHIKFYGQRGIITQELWERYKYCNKKYDKD